MAAARGGIAARAGAARQSSNEASKEATDAGRGERFGALRLVQFAVAAAVVMVVASWSAGGIPTGWQRVLLVPAQVGYYLALLVYCAAWLLLGRRVWNADPTVDFALLRRFIVGAATPFLFAAPFGRDLAAYAAQGNLVSRGVDPYLYGPAAVPGVFTSEIGWRWSHSPAPYGPVWLRVSQFARWLSGGHPLVAELLLRLPAFVGLLLCIWALPRIADRLRGNVMRAAWLGAASPLVIVLGVGGGHNDLLMMGLALAGLAVACGPSLRRLAIGAALTGLAAMIKSPAIVITAFAVPAWLAAHRAATQPPVAWRKVVAACGVAAAGATVAVLVCQFAGNLGWGWARQVDSDPAFNSPFALPTALVLLVRTVLGMGTVPPHDAVLHAARTGGEVLAAILLLALWLRAVHHARLRRDTTALGPLVAALVVLAVLAPLVQPWYYAWSLLIAGFVLVRVWSRTVVAAAAILLTAMILPSGLGWLGSWGALVLAPIALGLGWAILGRPMRPARADYGRELR